MLGAALRADKTVLMFPWRAPLTQHRSKLLAPFLPRFTSGALRDFTAASYRSPQAGGDIDAAARLTTRCRFATVKL
jgi:hypothetical protein